MSFKQAALNTQVVARTENGMKAFNSTLSPVVDLFYKAGSSRGRNITAEFEQAYQADRDLALRLAQWVRDVRGGAGERKIFRDFLVHLETYHRDDLLTTNLLEKVPELGRWDDLLVFTDTEVKTEAYRVIALALSKGNGLAAKWMPRKGKIAAELRNFMELSPKSYRKLLVTLTKVVETQMCAKDWDAINFSHVPSLAMSRYTKAFAKRATDSFTAYKQALVKGDPTVKVNAGAVFPYDIIKSIRVGGDKTVNDKQWDALPNFIGDASVLPLVDVSGSMTSPINHKKYGPDTVTCLDVAVSLGLYCSSKNTGPFKDLFLTFSVDPQFVHVTGTLSQRMAQMIRSKWEMNTNLHRAFERILDVAVQNNVAPSDMPGMLLILSDMQFDYCIRFDDSAHQMIQRKYEAAGYQVPKIVFWNMNAEYDNVPVKFDTRGTALVSGFSPAIMKSVLANDLETFTPENVMLKTLLIDRYALQSV